MIYKAEDVSVKVDGVEIAATSLSFSTSAPLAEDRRLGKSIGGKDFSPNGPQKSSLRMNFYVTGTATGDNPIFGLLRGEDAYNVNVLSGITGFEETVGKTFKRRYDEEVTGSLYEYLGEYYVYALRYDAISDKILVWRGKNPTGQWLSGDGVFGTGEYSTYEAFLTTNFEEFYGSGGNLFEVGTEQTGTGQITQVGTLGVFTGSNISLGNTSFASGAALTSLGFSISPFNPVECQAEFDIYNPVTGTFSASGGNISITPASIAHGMFSYYSGVTGISDVSSISWSIQAERIPRYVVGKKNVHEIKTAKAIKTLSFQGWGASTPVLETAPETFVVSLGSEGGSIFTDIVSGSVMDESFDIPSAGIMAKNFTIIENLL